MSYSLGIVAIIAIIIFYIIALYNSLIRKRNQVLNIEAGVDVQLKKRYDLLPNLVASVKQYLNHEKALLIKITTLRTQAEDSQTSQQKFQFNNELSNLLPNLNIAVEAYPDLKSNQNILNLQQSLNEIEEQISAARRAYNAAVEVYNNAIEIFPSNLIANLMGFKKSAFFDIPSKESENYHVNELFKRE